MTQETKIVVTGIGAITPLGIDLPSIFDHLHHLKSGIRHLVHEAFAYSSVKHASIIPEEDIQRAFARLKNNNKTYTKMMNLAQYAAEQAMEHAAYQPGIYDPRRTGCFIGTEPATIDIAKNIALLDEVLKAHKEMPSFAQCIDSGLFPNLLLSHIQERFGFRGPAFCHFGTCSASAQAIGEAARMLKYHCVDLMLAGGLSSKIDPVSVARLIRVGALAPTNGDPALLSRPFDKRRCGFTMGEGAVIFVLEREKDALKRGVIPIAEVTGYGAALDGHSITDPHIDCLGMTLAMQRALDDARLRDLDIDYLNAHGTSTVKNDTYETLAIKKVFSNAASLDISSTKSLHGHLMSCAGAMEALVAIYSIQQSVIPPTINYAVPDLECDLHYTPNIPKLKKIQHVMSNSFGLGGQNCSLIFSKLE